MLPASQKVSKLALFVPGRRQQQGIPGRNVVALLAEASGWAPRYQSRSAGRGPNERLPAAPVHEWSASSPPETAGYSRVARHKFVSRKHKKAGGAAHCRSPTLGKTVSSWSCSSGSHACGADQVARKLTPKRRARHPAALAGPPGKSKRPSRLAARRLVGAGQCWLRHDMFRAVVVKQGHCHKTSTQRLGLGPETFELLFFIFILRLTTILTLILIMILSLMSIFIVVVKSILIRILIVILL